MAPSTLDLPTRIVSAAVPPDMAARLAELARQNDRSISGEIRRALAAHLEHEKQED